MDVHHDIVGAADALHLLKETFDGVRAILELPIVGRCLVDVGVEQTASERHVVQLGRKVGFDERNDFVEIEQAQIRIGFGLYCGSTPPARPRTLAPRSSSLRARIGARHRRARLRAERIENRLLLSEHAALKFRRVPNTSGTCFSALDCQRLAIRRCSR